MSSGSQPSLNAFCTATTVVPSSQLSGAELISLRKAALQYYEQPNQNGVFAAYRKPFLNNTQRILYKKAQTISGAPKGPLPSQNIAVELQVLQNLQGCTPPSGF